MVDFVLQEHPDYQEKKEDWNLCLKLFEGKHKVVCVDPQIFWTHAVEDTSFSDDTTSIGKLLSNIGKSQWSRRSQRSRWLALPEIVASLIISFIFRKCPDFSKIEKLFGEDIKNVDGKGNSLYTFMKNSFGLDYIRYGKAIIKVETARHGAVTLADEIGKNVRPYFTQVSPLNVPDWEVADGKAANNFSALRYEYLRVKSRTKLTEEAKQEKISKVYYQTPNGILVDVYSADVQNKSQTNQGWVQNDQQTIDLSRIPFVVLEDVSWLKDVNQEALRFHNLRSSRDNILYSQGYQKVVVFGVDPSDPAQLQAMSETTWNLVRAPEGSAQAIEPPDLSSHEKALEESLNNIFKVGLNQLRLLPSDSKVAQSADSIGEEKDNTIALIESTLEDIENATNDAISLWAEYKGVKGFHEKIEIEKTFTKTDITKFVTVFGAMRDQFTKYEKVMKFATMKGVRELGLDEDDQIEALAEVSAGKQIEVEPVEEEKDPVAAQLGE